MVYLDENGKLVTENLRDYSRNSIRAHYASLDAFLRRWQDEESKKRVMEERAEEDLPLQALMDKVGKHLDPFDLI